MQFLKQKILCLILIVIFISTFSCSTKRSVSYLKHKIANNSNIAVIIDCPNKIKNVVLTKFMKKGFRVKAFNASDFYSLNEIFDISDFTKISYTSSSNVEDSLLSMEKTYNNIYKLHIYNFESNKAEILSEMNKKWNIKYLILLDLKDWESVSWGRVIDMNTLELLWVENYPTRYNDRIEDIVNHFINSLTGK